MPSKIVKTYPRLADLVRLSGFGEFDQVAVEHDQVGLLADFDRAESLLVAEELRPVDRVGRDRFVNVDSLIGVERSDLRSRA